MMIRKIAYWLLALLFVAPVSQAQELSNKFVVYQMMIRLFGNTNTTNITYGTIDENGVGRFSDINDNALTELANFGANYVWYTGVIEHATMSKIGDVLPDDADVVKGRAGSPYAIKDYYDVNPYLADNPNNRIAEFKALIDRTHAAGLKVIIDLVPNHVARTYQSDKAPTGVVDFGQNDDATKSFSSQNNFYYMVGEDFVVPTAHDPLGAEVAPGEDDVFTESPAKVSGNDVFKSAPSKDDWFETIKLNYGRDYTNNIDHFDPIPQTWTQVRDIVAYWSAMGVDGFRCDMAEMVPVNFWEWMIADVKQDYPAAIFIAEIYNPARYKDYLNQGGFDYLYDKVGTYDALRAVIQGTGEVKNVHQEIEALSDYDQKMVRFVENHDEQRAASANFGNSGRAGFAMAAASMLSGKGPYMHYFGQEVGERGEGVEGFQKEDGRTTIFDYWGVEQHQKWVNEGAYDGGQLSDSAQSLREGYQSLMRFVSDHQKGVLGSASYQAVPNENPQLLVFYRGDLKGKFAYVIVELRGEAAQISLPKEVLGDDTTRLRWKPNLVDSSNDSKDVEITPYEVVVISR